MTPHYMSSYHGLCVKLYIYIYIYTVYRTCYDQTRLREGDVPLLSTGVLAVILCQLIGASMVGGVHVPVLQLISGTR